MALNFPRYDRDRPAPILAEVCETCGVALRTTSLNIVMSGGALIENPSTAEILDDRLLGFLYISHHQIFPKIVCGESDAAGRIAVVQHARSGQFTLGFCSTECFKNFLEEIYSKVVESIGAVSAKFREAEK